MHMVSNIVDYLVIEAGQLPLTAFDISRCISGLMVLDICLDNSQL